MALRLWIGVAETPCAVELLRCAPACGSQQMRRLPSGSGLARVPRPHSKATGGRGMRIPRNLNSRPASGLT